MSEGSEKIEALLDRLRPQLIARSREAEEIVRRIKAAADEYLVAVEQDLAASLVAQADADPPRVLAAPVAAMRVRTLVDELPTTVPDPTAKPLGGTPEVPTAAVPVTPPAPAPAPPPRPVDPAVALRALFAEFQELDLDTVTNDVFRAMAEEFACRARAFQDQSVPDPQDFVGRIVRKLTALSSARGLRDIFGLKRAHQADWNARAQRARDTRDRLLNPAPKPTPARVAAPPPRPAAVVEPTPSESEEAEDDFADVPLLRALAETQSIVLMGGVVKNDKLTRLRDQIGKKVEWIATDAAGTKAIAALEKRVADGRVGAVIVLEELIGHKHYEPIVAAARQLGVPVTYGAKAGKAAIARAFREIEAALVGQNARSGG